MHIEAATCPCCKAAFNPLRAHAVTVIDGRVRAFCSTACRERGVAPATVAARPEPEGAAPVVVPARSSFWRALPTDIKVLVAAASTALAAFGAMIHAGRRAMPVSASPARIELAKVATTSHADPMHSDAWLQPLAGERRHWTVREPSLFLGREGVPVEECAGARCAIDIEATAGAVVMAVRDGVVEEVERGVDGTEGRGQQGRFIRINHDGGAIATSYWQLDGIREDLRSGIPVGIGEPIATIGRNAGTGGGPHLRFGISVRNHDGKMLYINPRPLLTLWPTRKQAPGSLRAMERPSHVEGD